MDNLLTDEQKATIFKAVNEASAAWKLAFNSGDADGCAAQYEENAVIYFRPSETYTGTKQIKEFWEKLINNGFADVEYLDPKIEIVDGNRAVLTSNWKMNKVSGVIHKELWVLQADGTAKLREDDFEVL